MQVCKSGKTVGNRSARIKKAIKAVWSRRIATRFHKFSPVSGINPLPSTGPFFGGKDTRRYHFQKYYTFTAPRQAVVAQENTGSDAGNFLFPSPLDSSSLGLDSAWRDSHKCWCKVQTLEYFIPRTPPEPRYTPSLNTDKRR